MTEPIRPLRSRALIGMVHLAPLPGSPASKWSLDRIIAQACTDALHLSESGFDALLMENFGDAPFRATTVDAHTVACMTVVGRAVRQAVSLPIGINVLRNDATAALAIATTCDAAFVRVNVHCGVYATDQGIIEGRADETLRYRNRLNNNTAIFADVHVKHASPLRAQPISMAAEEVAYRGRADGIIVTGTGTGKPTCIEDVLRVREAVPDRPIFVASGATINKVHDLLAIADGIIVGTAIKENGQTTAPVDRARAEAFFKAARN